MHYKAINTSNTCKMSSLHFTYMQFKFLKLILILNLVQNSILLKLILILNLVQNSILLKLILILNLVQILIC